jgi:formamidopyrimidine-DNA glycosylase
MPELPEAETIARKLDAALRGRTFDKVLHLRRDMVRSRPQRAPAWIEGAAVERVTRRGKRPIIHLAGGKGMVVFLGMTGHLAVHGASAAVFPHTHLRIALRGGDRELRFSDYRRFGGISFFALQNGEVPPGVADLGPEPLEMTAAQFRQILARPRQIKALLLDQSAIAGLGNIYCDEALFRVGIHPLECAARIDPERAGRLAAAIRRVLREAIRYEGTTIINYAHPDGPGAYQRKLWVYDRAGQPCRRCRTPIATMPAAGRTTHYCPTCQPAPRRRRR